MRSDTIRPRAWLRRIALSEYLIFFLCLAYVAILAPFTPGFVSGGNMSNVAIAAMPLFLLAVGQTFVLITGGIDLSTTSIVGLTSVLGAMVMAQGWFTGTVFSCPMGIILMLAVGTVIGACNGIAVAVLRMPAFIVTLTGMMFFSGLAVWITQSKNVSGLPQAFVAFGANPWSALALTALFGGFAHLMLARSLYGRWLYATGHSVKVACISGVPVTGVTVAAYAVSGLCAGLSSVLYTAQAETGSPVLGQRLLLDVIGATVLGGTSLFGGRGKVLWSLGGVLFLKLVDNSLNLIGVSLFGITMIKGGVILAAALIDVARVRLEKGATT